MNNSQYQRVVSGINSSAHSDLNYFSLRALALDPVYSVGLQAYVTKMMGQSGILAFVSKLEDRVRMDYLKHLSKAFPKPN